MTSETRNPAPAEDKPKEPLDPNESNRLVDQIRGQTMEHATPPRLEDEGQSGG